MENREYFALHGIDVDALESTHSSNKAVARSTTTLLVKNLPPTTVPEELESMFARFGSIAGGFIRYYPIHPYVHLYRQSFSVSNYDD